MIEDFKSWIIEISDNAIDEKKAKARSKGDESKWQREIWSSPEKNKAIKSKFMLEGEKLGYRTRPSRTTNAREWLYDFVWRRFDEHGNFVGVDLAMEIEVSDMNTGGIRYDFNKLLQSDSKYKILVFQLKTEPEVVSAIDALHTSSMAYSSKVAAEFLICGWITSKNIFEFKAFSTVALSA